LGFDTSNYTTSAAFFDGGSGSSRGALLEVPEGKIGLRQSDALFQHMKRLPDILSQLNMDFSRLEAVGVSEKPRDVQDSYMPCFLPGVSAGKMLADAFHVPLYSFSHQEGHLAAAAWSAGQIELLNIPFLAWHLSGGTTELLYIAPEGARLSCSRIGGSTDLSAGQLIDRTGNRLGLSFPSGRELDLLAQRTDLTDFFTLKAKDLWFSLSGMENQIMSLLEKKRTPEEAASFVFRSVAEVIRKVNQEAQRRFGKLPLLYSGGVSASRFLRAVLTDGIFCKPEYASDNAMGIAILTHRAVRNE
jgi:N6-L-threonylcarbamoyladenine synthase